MNNRALVTTALLVAVGVVLVLLWTIPPFNFLSIGWMLGAPWLQFNPGDIPTLLGSFALGPAFGGIIALVRAAISNFIAGSGGPIGFIMDASASFVLAVVAGFIYHFKRTRTGAILALCGGTIAMTIASFLLNYFWAYPAFGLPAELALATAVPFNLIKGLINCVVVYVLYKRLSPILHGRTDK